MVADIASIGREELRILAALLNLGKGTVQQVKEALPNTSVGYATVQTVLRRLEKKRYIGHERSGRKYVFRPLVSQKDMISRGIKDLTRCFFGDDCVKLVEYILTETPWQSTDRAKLRSLISDV
jgi:BlaI family penicillinase repressor